MQTKTNTHVYKVVTGNYTLDLTTDEVVLINPSADCVITIPEASNLVNDNLLHEYRFKNASDYTITLQLSGSDTFSQGHNKVVLNSKGQMITLGGNYSLGWNNTIGINVDEKVHRNTNWSSSNFSSYAAIPFDVVEFEDNNAILEWDSSGKTKVTCKIKTRVYLSYTIDIDSTGGSTWIVNTKLRKNGTDDISGTGIRTGNYGGEDQSGALPFVPIDLDANDYIELMIDQDSLSGNLVAAILTIQTTI